MKPYFLLSGFFYTLSMLWLFFLDPQADNLDFQIVGWVHLYMLGFVMLSIFSAMAQLGPIVVEIKHANEKVFNYVWIFLTVGLIYMLVGFYIETIYLINGGVLVLIAMSIYALEFLLTLRDMKRKTSVTNAMKMSNFFLLFGIITGLMMAFGILLEDNNLFFGGIVLLAVGGIIFLSVIYAILKHKA
jgi:hypothetical protein